LLDSNRYARDPSGVPGQIGETISKEGGEMLASRLWSEQKLAYPIAGHRKGTYWLTYFRVDSSKLSVLNRQFQLNDAVLRNMMLVVDDRLADTLVQHASPGQTRDVATTTAPDAAEKTVKPPEKPSRATVAAE
jgi:small subunit ribosomal protein S6